MEREEETVEIFLSYHQKDKDLLEALKRHLDAAHITSWDESRVSPGDPRIQVIRAHLDTAQIILLLISASFMAAQPEYISLAIERHRAGEARMIPVILHPVEWKKSPFGGLEALPKGKPVVKWQSSDDAFADIARGILRVIADLQAKHKDTPTPPLPQQAPPKMQDAKDIRKEEEERPTEAPTSTPSPGQQADSLATEVSRKRDTEGGNGPQGDSLMIENNNPPQRRKRLLVRLAAILIVVLIGGTILGVLVYQNHVSAIQAQANATNTAQAQTNASATSGVLVNATSTAQAEASATAGALANATGTAQAQATATATVPSVSITYPADGSTVDMVITVQGTASNIPSDKNLWVIIVPAAVNKYYPQPGPVVVTGNIWSSNATIGVPDDHGERFTLIVALADQNGSSAISNYLQQSNQTQVYPGMLSLPQGVVPMVQIHVTRN